jgi:hypothetical protein
MVVAAGLLLALDVTSSPKSSPTPSGTVASAPASLPAPHLWGDLKPIVSVKELMRDMLDPAADNIFDAVKIVYTKTGTIETAPKTEKDWEKIRIGAVTLAEGVYLLKIRARSRRPGTKTTARWLPPRNYRRLRSRRSSRPTRCSGTRKSKRSATSASRSWKS